MIFNRLVAIVLISIIGFLTYFRSSVYYVLNQQDTHNLYDKVDFLPQNEKDWLFAIIYTALLAVLSLVFIFLSFGRKKYVRITGGIYLLLFITIVLLIFGGSMLRNKLFYNLTFYLHFVLQTPIVVGVMFFYFWKLRPMKLRDKV